MIHILSQPTLEKIKPDATSFKDPYLQASAFCQEEITYQLVLCSDEMCGETVSYEVLPGFTTKLYQVKPVCVSWPHYNDDLKKDYCIDSPGFLPDILDPIPLKGTLLINNNITVLWVSILARQPGNYIHSIRFKTRNYERTANFSVHVLPLKLPDPEFCLVPYIDPQSIADSYNVPLYSDVFWELLEKYFKIAHDAGVDTIILPIFPVIYDREVEFKPVQLIRVIEENKKYRYNYDLLDCWLFLMKKCGINNIVIPPIFPSFRNIQCPEIICQSGRMETVLFDANADMRSSEYTTFIRRFLKAFLLHLEEFKFDGEVEFQISSRPLYIDTEAYKDCRAAVFDAIKRRKVTDALVDIHFYDTKLSAMPSIYLHDLKEFLRDDITITCHTVSLDINSSADVFNFLIAAPAVRLRSMGLFSYYHNIFRVLNLGFNLCLSKDGKAVDLKLDTDNGGSYPSGSCSLVYPGMNGPLSSVRLKQIQLAAQDFRLLRLVDRYIPRSKLLKLLERDFGITPEYLDVTAESYLKFKEKIYEYIEKEFLKE
ncbi:MAG: DUF4091 domain-containing protein [Clostridia bacterium]|nr:DUF4091 domain-containing protein [Clostridia bacterium]